MKKSKKSRNCQVHLEKRINKFEADEFNGFIPLLDKIVELTKEQAV